MFETDAYTDSMHVHLLILSPDQCRLRIVARKENFDVYRFRIIRFDSQRSEFGYRSHPNASTRRICSSRGGPLSSRPWHNGLFQTGARPGRCRPASVSHVVGGGGAGAVMESRRHVAAAACLCRRNRQSGDLSVRHEGAAHSAPRPRFCPASTPFDRIRSAPKRDAKLICSQPSGLTVNRRVNGGFCFEGPEQSTTECLPVDSGPSASTCYYSRSERSDLIASCICLAAQSAQTNAPTLLVAVGHDAPTLAIK